MNRSRWFEDVTDIETLRKQYRELLKKFHPDNAGGSVEITQEINAEYDRLFVFVSIAVKRPNPLPDNFNGHIKAADGVQNRLKFLVFLLGIRVSVCLALLAQNDK